MMIVRRLFMIRVGRVGGFRFSDKNKTDQQQSAKDHVDDNKKIQEESSTSEGTEYNKWALSRVGQSHNIQIMRRTELKDRYSIHRLTNIDFMYQFVTKDQYNIELTLNEYIIFLAQFYHLVEITGRDKEFYMHVLDILFSTIVVMMNNPNDLICMGTFMSCAVSMYNFQPQLWEFFMDCIFRRKYDEEFDELFGMIVAFSKYRKNLLSMNSFEQLSKDQVIQKIPIFYRKCLHILRQFITINIYNLKQCRMICQSLHNASINQDYFWNSVRDWFNIFIKQQIKIKQIDQFFIFKENSVDRVLFDHGMIRPRPILQELVAIAFVLSQFGNISWRFVEFAQDLILYANENGSALFQRYQEIEAKEDEQQRNRPNISINTHFKTQNQSQKQKIRQMQRRYRTIFLSPISLKSKSVVQMIITFSRAFKLYKQPVSKNSDEKHTYFYDKKQEFPLDPRIKRWLFMQLIKEEMRYTVRELIALHRASQFFAEFSFDVITFISRKLIDPRYTSATFTQIEQLLKILPMNMYSSLNKILSDFLLSHHPSQIMQLTKKLQRQALFSYLPQYLYHIPKSANTHQKYFSFEQRCYFLLMVLQHKQIMQVLNNEQIRIKYQVEFQQLKHSIKITTYNRGFKIQVNSYFHQILEYIDVVEFFQGGRL